MWIVLSDNKTLSRTLSLEIDVKGQRKSIMSSKPLLKVLHADVHFYTFWTPNSMPEKIFIQVCFPNIFAMTFHCNIYYYFNYYPIISVFSRPKWFSLIERKKLATTQWSDFVQVASQVNWIFGNRTTTTDPWNPSPEDHVLF
jgi:hypothetical protein